MNLPLPPQLLPLLAVLVAGAVIGWLFPDPWRNRQRRFSASDAPDEMGPGESDGETSDEDLEDALRTMALLEEELEQLRSTSGDGSFEGMSAGAVPAEIDDLQSLVEELTERAERAEKDRDRARERSEELGAKVQKQQRQLDEAADRIVGLERERMQKGGRAPFRLSKSAAKSVDLEIVGDETVDAAPTSGKSLELEVEDPTTPIDQPAGLIPREAEAEPDLELEIEKSGPIVVGDATDESAAEDLEIERSGEGFMPPRRDHEAESAGQSAPEPSNDEEVEDRPAKTTVAEAEVEVEMEGQKTPPAPESEPEEHEPALTGEPGTSHPLHDVTGMSEDMAERFALIGVHSTLDLVRKAATRKSVNRLAISMNVEPRELERWVSFADLLRIERMRKDDIKPLVDLGIRSVQSLAKSDAKSLAHRLTKGGRNDKAPTQKIVEQWIERTRELEPMVRW